MKKQVLTKSGLIGSALVFSLLTAPVMAENSNDGPGQWRERLQQFDVDGDGQLNDREKQQARKAFHKKMREKYDTDGDGQLSETERQAFRDARHARIIEKFDTDGDGQLNDQEKATAREYREKHREKHGDMRDRRPDVVGNS